ncbi:hypothetical protein GQ44DRAFT_796839 [Phaeosphaeriaceae sp. PMI808]|nr:hypothetical protein GQ44DRAFT_796839 [Phaeosphaeriaceae sp. PMI808]
MSYQLRPERSRKRPARYQSDSEDEFNHDVEPRHSNSTFPNQTSRLPADTTYFSPACLPSRKLSSALCPLSSEQRTDSHSGSRADTPNDFHASSRACNMAKVKHIRRSRPHAEEDHRNQREDAAPVRTQNRSASRAVEHTRASIYPSMCPAAFPSLPLNAPVPEPDQPEGHLGLKQRLNAFRKCDQVGMESILAKIDTVYNDLKFPDDMDESQKAWYTELKGCWLPDEAAVKPIEFRSLWPSLRQTIIDQIHDDPSARGFYDPYHTVKWLIGLSGINLKTIMDENDEVWIDINDVPEHLLRFKRENPDVVLDPDTPPALEVVKAIRYLKQKHFPGSLLGSWQMPLPDLEAFIPPYLATTEPVQSDDKEIEPIALPIKRKRSFNALTTDQADDLLRRIQRPHNQPTIDTDAMPQHTNVTLPPVDTQDSHPGLNPRAPTIKKARKALGSTSRHEIHSPPTSSSIPRPQTSSTTPKAPPNTAIQKAVAAAKSHASTLWTQHASASTSPLHTAPPLTQSDPKTSFQALIHLYLLMRWRHAIITWLMQREAQNPYAGDESRYRELRARISEITGMEEGCKRRVGELRGMERGGRQGEGEGERSRRRKGEANGGFGGSTRVIPYREGEGGKEGEFVAAVTTLRDRVSSSSSSSGGGNGGPVAASVPVVVPVAAAQNQDTTGGGVAVMGTQNQGTGGGQGTRQDG